ncbi:Fe-S protein assembly chaperone HscA [Sandaracinus amylolyticus]|uniref:Fe-S protein assembly chaperone HscA n=1 Tax=Sandaracinus amylolyticus TaxID=927083 RepID=UPI001F00A7D4|nr:Fe-S protein assembly chaperone HscA [Sandaracinus amylolyticus]UJR79838.1 Fe-S protein assembly chaperone HscA [Sandaracinus amylolyticus]
MSLLQIHDPAAKPTAIGIDLGTTNSLVAYVSPTGAPVVIRDCDGHALVPSVVHYTGERVVVVGHRAQELALDHPRDTIVSVKRFMGRGADDPETRRMGPYRFASETGPVVRFEVGEGRVVTPIEVSAEILRELKERAEDDLGSVGGAVITVPAYFDDAQRQATKDAAKLAGLEVLRLLNEPTAAALAYGLDKKQNGRFAVYDLGGGTFDVTILDLDDGVFQVRSTGGDSQLGGDDMDRALAEKVLAALGRDDTSPHAIRYALHAARSIKHALTDHETVETELEHDGAKTTFRITRAEFDALVKPLLERTGVACRRALRDAQTAPDQIDGVILVGGATRVPAVRAYVASMFGKEPLADIDPDLVVAMGAAAQADMLGGSGPREDVLLLDVLPLSLGIEAMGGVVERILPRNTAIPCEAAQVFTTYAENQTGFEIHVVQGERELAEDCRSLARFTLKGIPPMPAGLPRLEVRFRVDADGILHVSAQERTTGLTQDVEVKPSYGLDDAAIEKMLMEAYEHGEDDIAARTLREQKVEAERVLHATEKALAEDGDLLEASERTVIDRAMQRLRDAAAKDEHRIIAARIEELDDATHAFAGRRMDRSIKNALAGRELETIEKDTASAKGIDAHMPPEARDD